MSQIQYTSRDSDFINQSARKCSISVLAHIFHELQLSACCKSPELHIRFSNIYVYTKIVNIYQALKHLYTFQMDLRKDQYFFDDQKLKIFVTF